LFSQFRLSRSHFISVHDYSKPTINLPHVHTVQFIQAHYCTRYSRPRGPICRCILLFACGRSNPCRVKSTRGGGGTHYGQNACEGRHISGQHIIFIRERIVLVRMLQDVRPALRSQIFVILAPVWRCCALVRLDRLRERIKKIEQYEQLDKMCNTNY
jgi:hypothetical protein